MTNNHVCGHDPLRGVGCEVVNCKYHASGLCCADSIKVESPNAIKRAETFCGTFSPRKSSME